MSDKLSPMYDKCIFMGYPKETKHYYFYYKSENKIVVARHAVFLKKEFLVRGSSGSNVQLEEIQITHESDVGGDFTIPFMDAESSGSRTSKLSSHDDEKVVQDTPPQGVMEEASQPHALRRSSRSSHPPERWLGLHQGLACDAEDSLTYMESMAQPDFVDCLEPCDLRYSLCTTIKFGTWLISLKELIRLKTNEFSSGNWMWTVI
jgi:hypothetical protein